MDTRGVRHIRAADRIAAVHAGLEALVILCLVAGPTWAGAALISLVALPMLTPRGRLRRRGRCWITDAENRLLRRAGRRGRPSMTRRLLAWATLGRWRPGARQQWYFVAAVVAVWALRAAWQAAGWLAGQ